MQKSVNNLSVRWLSILKSNGYKLTGPRQSVVEILTHSDKALSASTIYDMALAKYPAIGLVSVYRTLEKLEQLGLIQKVHQQEKCQEYTAAPEGHEHLLVCKVCGKVSYFHGDDINSLINDIEVRTGYQVEAHWLQLIGVCDQCRSERGQARNR